MVLYDKSLKRYLLCICVIFTFVSLVAAAIFLYHQPLLRIGARVPINYNEGWNAFHANHVSNGSPLYPGEDSLTTNNYTPLSYFIIACLSNIVGDHIIAGRIISAISLGIVSCMIALSVKQKGEWIAGVIASLFFINTVAIFFPEYICMADPQWLCHAVQLIGLNLIIKWNNNNDKNLVLYLAIFIFAISGFIKQSLIVLPVAIYIYLLLRSRGVFFRCLILGISVVGLMVIVFSSIYGISFIRDVFLDYRSWKLSLAAYNAERWLGKIEIPFALAIFASVITEKSNMKILLFLYFYVSCSWGLYLLGIEGVSGNALFDVIISASLIIGTIISNPKTIPLYNNPMIFCSKIIVLSLIVVSIAIAMPSRIGKIRDSAIDFDRQIEEVAYDIAYLSEHSGPAMCENLSLCYWAGKNFEVDYFNTGRKIKDGILTSQKLINLIESRYFSIIQISYDNGRTERFDKHVNQAIVENYSVDRNSPYTGFFYVPK
jgi:hypothetical protein